MAMLWYELLTGITPAPPAFYASRFYTIGIYGAFSWPHYIRILSYLQDHLLYEPLLLGLLFFIMHRKAWRNLPDEVFILPHFHSLMKRKISIGLLISILFLFWTTYLFVRLDEYLLFNYIRKTIPNYQFTLHPGSGTYPIQDLVLFFCTCLSLFISECFLTTYFLTRYGFRRTIICLFIWFVFRDTFLIYSTYPLLSSSYILNDWIYISNYSLPITAITGLILIALHGNSIPKIRLHGKKAGDLLLRFRDFLDRLIIRQK
jgi:hypothetical protein